MVRPAPAIVDRAPVEETPATDRLALFVPTVLCRGDSREHVHGAAAELVRTAPPGTLVVACGTSPDASRRARSLIARLGLSIGVHSGVPTVAYHVEEHERDELDEQGRSQNVTVPGRWKAYRLAVGVTWQDVEEELKKEGENALSS